MILVLYVFVVGTVSSTWALNNGLARTPPMGFLSHQRFKCITDCKKYPKECISENLFLRTADLMVSQGYLAAGYNYIVIDDCWQEKERDRDGTLVPDRQRFPNGMKYIADYLHKKGFKIGINADYGKETCFGYPGSFKHEQIDIDTFVSWEIDYLKLDGCHMNTKNMDKEFVEFGKKLNMTGRPILLSCVWPFNREVRKQYPNYELVLKHCNTWRIWDDIRDSYDTLALLLDFMSRSQYRFAKYAGPGHWNDPDMLLIGNFGLSEDQARVQMAVWAILAAPLLISADLATMKPEFKAILLNKYIIKVNQDPLGKQGLRVERFLDDDGNIDVTMMEIWTRELHDGSYAVAFVSSTDIGVPLEYNVTVDKMKLTANQEYEVYDFYKEEGMRRWKSSNHFEVRINPTGVKFYKFIPQRGTRGK